MSVKYIPPSKNVGESVHDINDNFETLDKQNEAIARTVANKADTTDVQNLAEQLNNKANASDLEAKVSNDQTGATELIDALGESNATPGTEDSFIVKSLNQYTRRPFTALLNWIKSNLAKVATSGSYSDLNDKPTLGNVAAKTIKTATKATNTNFTSVAESQKYVPDMSFLSYWNGSYQSAGTSNLAYCKKGAFGTAATKGVDTDVTSNSANLVTSGGVATALANKVSTTSNTIVPTWWCGSNKANSSGYYHFLTVTMSKYADFNATLLITNEFASVYVGIFNIHIRCDDGTTSIVPNYMSWLVRRGWASNSIIAVVNDLIVKFYIKQDTSQYGGV